MRFILLSLVGVLLTACSATLPNPEKINGVSFVASRDSITVQHVEAVEALAANYAAVMPFGFIRDLKQPEIIFDTERQWFGETREGTKQYVEVLQSQGLKIMLKPQIWVWKGSYTGYISMTTESDWQQLEQSYRAFILTFARLAESLNIELFCIGTELELFVQARPDFWRLLIDEIRGVYNGSLTYAANWDEFKRTPFWDKLDYIGIDAYFPVCDAQTPTVEECEAGWTAHKAAITSVMKSHLKPVLFTEYGYRSVDYTGKEPWQSDHRLTAVNLRGQENAMMALMNTFWKEPWFAGGFVWKWHHRHDRSGGENDHMFTPQNKPAQEVLRKTYSAYR